LSERQYFGPTKIFSIETLLYKTTRKIYNYKEPILFITNGL